MPLLSNYQTEIVANLSKYNFRRIKKFKGSCHDALIGEWVNWWFKQKNIDPMICNPARQSKLGSRRCFADILFLERYEEDDHYQVKGVAEIENSKNKVLDKIKKLGTYEYYSIRGYRTYPDLEFAILCYTIDDDNPLEEKIIQRIYSISHNSNLLWIIYTLYKSSKKEADYLIHMPEYVKNTDYFYYYQNFGSVKIQFIKNGKRV